MAFIGVSVTAFPSLCEIVLSGTKLLRKIVRIVNAKLGHHLLLFGWPRFSGGKGIFKHWRRFGSNGCPFMELLAKEICLIGQQDLSPFNFAKVEALSGDLLGSSHHRIGVGTHEVSKVLSCTDDFVEHFFFIRLEWKILYIILPVLQVFKLGTSCISWNLDPPVADGTGILIVFLDFTASYLQALAMIPG